MAQFRPAVSVGIGVGIGMSISGALGGRLRALCVCTQLDTTWPFHTQPCTCCLSHAPAVQSLDGLERLTAVRFLYLDHNNLPESELLRLPGVPCLQLVALQSSLHAWLSVRCCRQHPCSDPPMHHPTGRPALLPAPSDLLPAGVRLETLDLRGNPGLTPAV